MLRDIDMLWRKSNQKGIKKWINYSHCHHHIVEGFWFPNGESLNFRLTIIWNYINNSRLCCHFIYRPLKCWSPLWIRINVLPRIQFEKCYRPECMCINCTCNQSPSTSVILKVCVLQWFFLNCTDYTEVHVFRIPRKHIELDEKVW